MKTHCEVDSGQILLTNAKNDKHCFFVFSDVISFGACFFWAGTLISISAPLDPPQCPRVWAGGGIPPPELCGTACTARGGAPPSLDFAVLLLRRWGVYAPPSNFELTLPWLVAAGAFFSIFLRFYSPGVLFLIDFWLFFDDFY